MATSEEQEIQDLAQEIHDTGVDSDTLVEIASVLLSSWLNRDD